ncbi:MAG: ATP synthase subunit alpha [Candidatus Roizmanbacteria bacterium GW2011_GWA2_37_7]|uniref:ATP synthase subunit alpha n=1 Tax=Candidatus Roizmanbacteria bacterium GW2011_GWA2_37_7 TaxID=1618481 RepID=A0A0G0JL18_9BACT|nr:MAG: ATP synthase subunit alpha [Candidatus Roizmanbacteria bacterium GW2011_GWA2_37_7]
MKQLDQYIEQIEKELKSQKGIQVETREIGYVTEVKDGVVTLTGLDNIGYGDLIEFENGERAMVIDLLEDTVGAIVLGDYLGLTAGHKAKGTGITLSIPVNDSILGRVVDPLIRSLDDGMSIKSKIYYQIERQAAGIVKRQSVSQPVQTGIKAIDSLIPIGRGQRELIIGDRGTGKTTIAVDTIINQKGQDMICVYCAIGQKNSKVATIIELLKKKGAMDYTIVVNASASDPVTLQYLAPYSATAIAEYFMDRGKDVLIVYDDLSKHAWAYRQVSLILRRPAGREAYPGDVFYLHSRLLERASRIHPKYGGGSITALPIIETLENDVSAYIPTNVISITDGQIFLETDLFNAGVRPAVNVGLSVSRVGSAAQAKAMKQVAGKLKLDLAQYRELSAFSQFESDLDEETKKQLNRGAKMTQILKQKQSNPYSLGEEVAIIWAGSKGYLDTLSLNEVTIFESKFLDDLRTRGKKILSEINKEKIITDAIEKELERYVKDNMPEKTEVPK